MRAPPSLALAVLLVSGLVSGCADPGSSGTSGEGDEPASFDVQATETTGVIRGIVVDDAIRPIAGALVNITGSPKSATTGDDGAFAFSGLEPGTYFLQVAKFGFSTVQTSTDVVAGESEPPIVKVSIVRIPSLQPFIDAYSFTGFLSFGAAVGVTSVGTTVNPTLAETLGDQSIWYLAFTQLPWWAQAELVWEHTQPAGGEFILEMTDTSNTHHGYRETAPSPALAYWNTTTLVANNESTLDPDRGIAYRFFGGPHPALKPDPASCPTVDVPTLGSRNPCRFGYGLTVQQRADIYIHNFYNFVPPEGWRFTNDGLPPVPET